MRRAGAILAAVALFLTMSPVMGQSDGEGNIARTIFWRPKPGMKKEMERGIKKHMEWHKKQNDPWSWFVWEIVSGDETGMYGGGTFGHHWADFDNYPVSEEADKADAEENVFPYIEPPVVRYYAHLQNVSRPSEDDGGTAMSVVVTFSVRFGKVEEFNHLIAKFHEAIGKTGWPVHYDWYALTAGGEGSTFVLVLPRGKWADFAPQEKSFQAMIEEAFGRPEAEALLDKWGEAVIGTSSAIASDRPDLSYIAGAKD